MQRQRRGERRLPLQHPPVARHARRADAQQRPRDLQARALDREAPHVLAAPPVDGDACAGGHAAVVAVDERARGH